MVRRLGKPTPLSFVAFLAFLSLFGVIESERGSNKLESTLHGNGIGLWRYKVVNNTTISLSYIGENALEKLIHSMRLTIHPQFKTPPDFLRTTHYFSTGNPLSFWEGLELSKVDDELQQIKSDGFNSVILVIPWGGFQVSTDPVLFDPWLYYRLFDVMLRLKKAGLMVSARIGYSHNYNPDNVPPANMRCRSLLCNHDGSLLKAWVAYVKSLQLIFQKFDNFLFAFITWEDHSCVLHMMDANQDDRLQVARECGFQQYLASHGYANSSQCSIPRDDGTNPTIVRHWRNFYQHHWRHILDAGVSVMPHLTMEVRIDKDPIRLPSNQIEWYANNHMVHLGKDTPRAIYYAPFWGSENKNKSINATRALELFELMLTSAGMLAETNLLFVEQFNFFDNTPNFQGKNDYINPEDVPEFLRGSVAILKNRTMGYGLWSYRAYRESHLFNPSFERGLHGWRVDGEKAYAVRTPSGDISALLIGETALHASSPTQPAVACDGGESTVNICATYQLLRGGGSLHLKVNDVSYEVGLLLGDPPLQLCIKHKLSPWTAQTHLSFYVPDGSHVVLDDVHVACHIQTLQVYDEHGRPERYLSAVRAFNFAFKDFFF